MATHSSILAWKIPGTEEPGGLQSVMGSQRIGSFSLRDTFFQVALVVKNLPVKEGDIGDIRDMGLIRG